MLSQNTQDSIQQSLFATAMKVNPTVMHNASQLTKPTSGMRQVQMAAAKPSLAGNFNGPQVKSSFNTAASVQRRNYTVSMSMQSNSNNQQMPASGSFSTRTYLEGPQMNM